MATILEALQNAQYNFNSKHSFSAGIAKEQLANAIDLLKKGYSPSDDVEEIIELYGSINRAPEKKD